MIIKACVSVGLLTSHVLFIHAKTRRHRSRGNYNLLADHVWIISSRAFLLPASLSFPSDLRSESHLQLTSFSPVDYNNLPVFVLEINFWR